MEAGVSVVICTYNGAKRLPETIRHLALQKAPVHIPWEVVVIDNNSGDSSGNVALEEWSKYNSTTQFAVFHQPKKGLSAAREMGFALSRYEYILLCDDDNWLEEKYVHTAFEQMQANAGIGILGGKGELVFEKPPPGWLWDFKLLASGPQAWESGPVARNVVYGAGAVLRRSALARLKKGGFEFMLSDRNGDQMASGGDHELCYGLVLAGYQVWYEETLQFKHFITEERITWRFYQKYIHESSQCFPVLESYKILLKAGSGTVGFWIELFRTLMFLVNNYLKISLKLMDASQASDEHKILTMKRSLLATRIRMYCKFYRFRSYFKKAVSLRDGLQDVKPKRGTLAATKPKHGHAGNLSYHTNDL